MKQRLPWLLVWLRLMLAPAMLALALWWPRSVAFAVCLLAAFLSDYFDGVLARRWGSATAGLRRFDSFTDTVFCLAAFVAVWLLQPQTIRGALWGLSALFFLEMLRYLVDFLKFGREASYHMWSSKLWAVALYLACWMLLVGGEGGVWVAIAIGIGIVSDLEGLLISLLLPVWRHDVPSVFHAWRTRRHAH